MAGHRAAPGPHFTRLSQRGYGVSMSTNVKLQVACKHCGRQIISPIQMDPKSFESSTLSNNSYQCPSCGKSALYNTEDHFFDTAD